VEFNSQLQRPSAKHNLEVMFDFVTDKLRSYVKPHVLHPELLLFHLQLLPIAILKQQSESCLPIVPDEGIHNLIRNLLSDVGLGLHRLLL
jgi:hypothetical protein